MLVLGAQIGSYFGTYADRWFPFLGNDPTAFAVTGMAALFTAVVRAPVTGIILVIELTASDTQLLSMLAACFPAMLIPTLFGSRPIYDSLGERTK
jgi:CIC family chloride channel protein